MPSQGQLLSCLGKDRKTVFKHKKEKYVLQGQLQ